MKLKKPTSLLISGLFLTIFSLSDLENFNYFLHGFFLVIGVLAIVMSFIAYRKSKNND